MKEERNSQSVEMLYFVVIILCWLLLLSSCCVTQSLTYLFTWWMFCATLTGWWCAAGRTYWHWRSWRLLLALLLCLLLNLLS